MWTVVLICIGIVFENVKFGNARDFAVRLNNIYGVDSAEGRLEIFYNDSWGTVCGDNFTNASARVACASLGFGSNGKVVRNRLGAGANPVWLSGVNCSGSENDIEECVNNGWSVHNCNHRDGVAISCGSVQDFAVRLNNSFGRAKNEGRLEIYYFGNWGTVCDDGFTDVSANVACASLGFGYKGIVIGNRYGAGADPIWLDDVWCTGTESGIEHCEHLPWREHDCNHGEDVSIRCGNTPEFAVRLSNSKEGRLEIYYSGRWGTVCDNNFTDVSARVACTSLGFGYIGAVTRNRQAIGTDPIWLDGVNCNGTEIGIHQCVHYGWGGHNCSHRNVVSIRCDCPVENLFGPSGKIPAPDFRLPDVKNVECYTYNIVPSGKAITITFLTFISGYSQNWLTISCESGNTSRSASWSGSQIPPFLMLSSCNLITTTLKRNWDKTWPILSFAYNTTEDIVKGGITTKPSNAFPRSDKNDTIVFNCTSASKSPPWWTITSQYFGENYTLTNPTCRLESLFRNFFTTETLGPGSCNLIFVAADDRSFNTYMYSAFILVCMDVTLSSARAILRQISPELRSNSSISSTSNVIRDEEIAISCNPSFVDRHSGPSLVFTHFLYSEGSHVQMRILRIYWTSEGNVISSSIETSNTSSYVMVKSHNNSVIPPYTCNIVFDFFSNIIGITANSTIEISFSTNRAEVLYWPTEYTMTITGHHNGQIRTSALLNCSAAANPPATYKWTDESNVSIADGPTIRINHDGKYTCTATNKIGAKHYQHSKSVNLKVVEDEKIQNMPVLILLGAAVVAIIILLSIVLSRICRQQAIDPDLGMEYELPQRGGEGNLYEAQLGTDTNDVNESEYDNIDDTSQHLPHISGIYDELEFDKINNTDEFL